MSKEYLEALNKFLDDYLELCEKLHTNRQEKMLLDKNSPYNVLKTYLESIDNSNPSEALKEIKTLRGFNQVELNNDENVNKSLDIIKQALLKAQEQKKAIAQFKEIVSLDYLCRVFGYPLGKQIKEYFMSNELLKQVLERVEE